MNNISLSLKIIFITLALSLISACTTSAKIGAYYAEKTILPQVAKLNTKGVTIKSIDGSWEIKSEEILIPQKIAHVKIDNRGYLNNTPLLVKQIIRESGVNFDSLDPLYKDAAMDIIISLPNSNEELYGKLIFFDVIAKTKDSSVKRMWSLGLREREIELALRGNLSASFQPYELPKSLVPDGSDSVSWVIYMSSFPI